MPMSHMHGTLTVCGLVFCCVCVFGHGQTGSLSFSASAEEFSYIQSSYCASVSKRNPPGEDRCAAWAWQDLLSGDMA